jgi:hypothetical protein
MSIVVRFPTSNITTEQYGAVRRVLEESGSWPADGCQLHVSFGDEHDIQVTEIWESREKLEAFGERLGPMFEAAGIELAGAPEILEAHTFEVF